MFKSYLAKTSSPNLNLVVIDDFHLKTVIVDDGLIAEGSFNWLSAARDRDSFYHNHEVTIIAQGKIAQPLIDRFYGSRVGEALLHAYSEKIEEKNKKGNREMPLHQLFTAKR